MYGNIPVTLSTMEFNFWLELATPSLLLFLFLYDSCSDCTNCSSAIRCHVCSAPALLLPGLLHHLHLLPKPVQSMMMQCPVKQNKTGKQRRGEGGKGGPLAVPGPAATPDLPLRLPVRLPAGEGGFLVAGRGTSSLELERGAQGAGRDLGHLPLVYACTRERTPHASGATWGGTQASR